MKKQQKINKYFNQKKKLTLKNDAYLNELKKYTVDLIESDITSNLLIKKNQRVKAIIFSKEKGIVAGINEAAWFLNKNNIKIKINKKDGEKVGKGDVILELSGKIKDILRIERIVLNLMQRMSGIATLTDYFIKKIKNKALICPTRKTYWGLLDKKAATLGGGGTHRLGLNDFILIKDNHLYFLRNKIEKLAKLLNKRKEFWEIEIKNKKEAYQAVSLEPDAVMFDNMKPKKIKKIIKKIRKNCPNIIFEISGQINIKSIKKYKKCKADIISSGNLTHSAKALDISLDIL